MLTRDSCQENSLMRPTKFPSFVPMETKPSAFAQSQYFTSLQLPALLAPGTGSPLLRETAHPASVAAGVPAAQLGRAEEIVSRELWVCIEKRLFGDSQAVSTHTTTPTKPGFQRLVFNSAQGGAEHNLIAP